MIIVRKGSATQSQLPSEPPFAAALLDNKAKFGTNEKKRKSVDTNMPKFFDSNGEILGGKTKWLKYWLPQEKNKLQYDKVFKISDDSIELKEYAQTKEIVPYELKEGFQAISIQDGKITYILDKKTKNIVITKVLSDEEHTHLRLKKKRRKRKEFIDKALANPWTHWATLTFSPELAPKMAYSYDEAKKAFMEFRKKIRRKYNNNVKYMAISEYGEKNGRIHWHILLYFDKTIVFEQARSQKGKLLYLTNSHNRNVLDDNKKSIPKLILPNWKYGNSDFYPIYNSSQKAVNYMSKYMMKNEGRAPYEEQGSKAKAYLASKNLNSPHKEYLMRHDKSNLLDENIQKKIEHAQATVQLNIYDKKIMTKKEAIIDDNGTTHTVKKNTYIIDITEKAHQSSTLTSPIDERPNCEI
ncbi:rolling circle replication-associated protein [Vagococcus zengguangii]|uniref:Replication-associated protein ORF2/G2P domain-containing protein n=1 Tax=Vagococcus zengguangii TaxID=2571750 RepID=A0A4D7CUB5_9ENTE|nr:hypothetical protein [Vagococcus zengguangii]QCI86903.1 hypothetical protein FA707_07945 [Vagococcus zengguangii]